MDCFTFTGAVGDRILARAIETSGELFPRIEVVGPTGATVCGPTFDEQVICQLGASGQHTALIYDSSTDTGGYGFHLQRLNTPVGCTALNLGVPTAGSIAAAAEVDCFTFPGAAGNQVSVNVTETGGTLLAEVDVRRPDGTDMCGPSTSSALACALDVAGVYTALIHEFFGTDTGTYQITVTCQTLPCGAAASATPTRTATPTPSFTATPSSTPTGTRTPSPIPTTFKDRNCSDFATWEEAQSFFLANGGPALDPHGLDADSDGIACEGLPNAPQNPATATAQAVTVTPANPSATLTPSPSPSGTTTTTPTSSPTSTQSVGVTATPSPSVTRSPAPTATPASSSSPTPTRSPTLTPPNGAVAGHGFNLQTNPGGPVVARWNGVQAAGSPAGVRSVAIPPTGFLGVGVDLTNGGVSVFPSDGTALPATATSFTDVTPGTGLKCYTLLVLAGNPVGSIPLGNTDLLCRWGLGSGSAPSDFTVRLDEGPVATLSWAPGSTGQGAVLWVLTTGELITLAPGVSSTTHNTGGAVACYVLLVTTGYTDALCPIPGAAALVKSGSTSVSGDVEQVRSYVDQPLSLVRP
jgi:hypothetical protein